MKKPVAILSISGILVKKLSMKKTYIKEIPTNRIVVIVFIAVTLTLGMSYLFYGKLGCAILMSPYTVWFCKKSFSEYKKKKKLILKNRFKEAMQLVSFSLSVGYSIENSFKEAIKQLTLLYGKNEQIVIEFTNMMRQVGMNENIEDIFLKFARNSEIDDIIYLAEVLKYAKRSGGDLINIIRNTIGTINQKISVDNEIQTAISGKKMEQKIMSIMPFGIILYLKISSPEFIIPLYGNIVGIIVMTICFLMYMVAMLLAEKIVNIEV